MKQQETQRNPDMTLRQPHYEEQAHKFQQQIHDKLKETQYTAIRDINQQQETLNKIIRETTQELFPPKPKPIKQTWITHETHATIQLQQNQWHEARIAGNLTGIPRWEQAFKQLDQLKQTTPENQHNRIEKDFIYENMEQFNCGAADIVTARKLWNE